MPGRKQLLLFFFYFSVRGVEQRGSWIPLHWTELQNFSAYGRKIDTHLAALITINQAFFLKLKIFETLTYAI